MDAHALLTSQGWRGTGHSLHPVSDSTGLSKPLLVSQKSNNLGVGKKQHKTSDMWWMNAFDKSLKGLDTSKEGEVVQTITSGGLDMVVKGGAKWVGGKGGLYASFVRGEGLVGTLTPSTESEDGGEVVREKKRRRVGGKDTEANEMKQERRARKAEKRARRAQESASEEMTEAGKKIETKEQWRTRRATENASKLQLDTIKEETQTLDVDEFAVEAETKESRRARKDAKRVLKAQQAAVEDAAEIMEVDSPSEKAETKEEKRERKRQKKLLKEAAQQVSEDSVSSESHKKKQRKD